MSDLVATFRIDVSIPLQPEWQAALRESSYETVEGNIHTFGWDRKAWKKAQCEDLDALESWMLKQDKEDEPKFQWLLLIEEDGLLVEHGSRGLGLKVTLGV